MITGCAIPGRTTMYNFLTLCMTDPLYPARNDTPFVRDLARLDALDPAEHGFCDGPESISFAWDGDVFSEVSDAAMMISTHDKAHFFFFFKDREPTCQPR